MFNFKLISFFKIKKKNLTEEAGAIKRSDFTNDGKLKVDLQKRKRKANLI